MARRAPGRLAGQSWRASDQLTAFSLPSPLPAHYNDSLDVDSTGVFDWADCRSAESGGPRRAAGNEVLRGKMTGAGVDIPAAEKKTMHKRQNVRLSPSSRRFQAATGCPYGSAEKRRTV